MTLDGLLAQEQFCSHVGIRHSVGDQLQDLQFALTQLGERVDLLRPGSLQFLDHTSCYTRVQYRLPNSSLADRRG
jgi:hypothetical protein